MTKINILLLKWEGFKYDTTLDLHIKYYHIWLSEYASNLCTIILPGVKFCGNHLPTRVRNSPDIFQHKTSDLFQWFEFICAYIYSLFILKKGVWVYHIEKL